MIKKLFDSLNFFYLCFKKKVQGSYISHSLLTCTGRQKTCDFLSEFCNCSLYPVIQGAVQYTYLFKLNRTLRFAYKIKSVFFCIDLPFGENHIYPIPGVPCKFGEDIFNIKDVVLIFQKDHQVLSCIFIIQSF